MRPIQVSEIIRTSRWFGLPLGLAIGLAFLLVSGCALGATPTRATGPASDEAAARQSLVRFFHNLNDGNFDAAANLYGGSYETMAEHNPLIDPSDHAALLKAACTLNGAQCLEIRSAQLEVGVSTKDNEFTFIVEFNRADGSSFSLGPCCGATAGSEHPLSRFPFQVRKTADQPFKVMTPPVYMP
jgi:hypothetical protein